MGYLELPSLSDFNKAVISLWFRVPSSTFDVMNALTSFSVEERAAMSEAGTANSDSMGFWGSAFGPFAYKVLPLMTFGTVEQDSRGVAVPPSYIGVSFYYDGPGPIVVLTCNLQTPDLHSGGDDNGNFRPACYNMQGWATNSLDPDNANVTPDEWHHVLISFDIGGGSSATQDPFPGDEHITGSSTFTWALDDISKVDTSMFESGGGSWAGEGLTDPQIIVPQLQDYVPSTGDGGTVSYGATHIGSGPVGIPASGGFTDSIQPVSVAMVQMWIGQNVDARDVGTRRLFVDDNGLPVDPQVAEDALGTPILRLVTSDDFIAGTDTGSGGDFTPVGTITKFSPSPSLRGGVIGV